MTEAQRKTKDRKITQQRLYGKSKEPLPEHVCKNPQKKKKV